MVPPYSSNGRTVMARPVSPEAMEPACMEMHTASQMGANAVVGVDIDYETFGNAGMLMVSATGTAVVVQNK